MSSNPFPSPPEKDGQQQSLEGLLSVAKLATLAIPGSSIVLDFIGHLVKKPLEDRRQDWFELVSEAINRILRRIEGMTPERLAEDPSFVTVLLRSSDAAVRTHEQEKRRFLRNALVSSGLPTRPGLDKQLYFVKLVDDLTVNQILVLHLFDDPRGWFSKRNVTPTVYRSGSRFEVLRQAYPDIAETKYVQELVLSDLERRGLVESMTVMFGGGNIYERGVTDLGHEFLDYIRDSDPESDAKE